MRDSMVVYYSFYEALKDLDNDTKVKIYDSIYEYGCLMKEPDNLDGISKVVWTLIKPQLDANIKKYKNGQKGANHGSKGGRPKKPQSNIDKNPLGVIYKNPTPLKEKTPNVNDNVNVNENLNENENEDIEKTSLSFSYDQMDNPSLMILEDYEKKASAIVSKYFTDLNFEQEDFMVYSDEKINKADIDISFPMKRLNRAFLTYIYRMNINNIQMVQVLIKSVQHKNGSSTSKFIIDKITQNIQYAYHRNYKQFYLENIK